MSFTLVWSLWRVAKHVASLMVPAVVVVSSNGFFVVHHVNVDVLVLWSSSHLRKAFNMVITVVETWSNNKSFVSVFLSVGKDDLVLLWVIAFNSDSEVDSGPFLDLTIDVCRFSLIR